MPTGEIEAREIVVVRKGKRILDGANLRVEPGEIAALLGPSGSGKSTLLRVLATLIEPDAGSVWLDGVQASSLSPRVYRSRVAFVPQQPPMLEGTVADNVRTGPMLHDVTLADADVLNLLDRVGLSDGFLTRDARQLSGGEQQRVALARALANQPEVLLLDEPTAALDPAAADRILGLIRDLAEDGLTTLVVTHVEEHALLLGRRRYEMVDGRIRQHRTETR